MVYYELKYISNIGTLFFSYCRIDKIHRKERLTAIENQWLVTRQYYT